MKQCRWKGCLVLAGLLLIVGCASSSRNPTCANIGRQIAYLKRNTSLKTDPQVEVLKEAYREYDC